MVIWPWAQQEVQESMSFKHLLYTYIQVHMGTHQYSEVHTGTDTYRLNIVMTEKLNHFIIKFFFLTY